MLRPSGKSGERDTNSQSEGSSFAMSTLRHSGIMIGRLAGAARDAAKLEELETEAIRLGLQELYSSTIAGVRDYEPAIGLPHSEKRAEKLKEHAETRNILWEQQVLIEQGLGYYDTSETRTIEIMGIEIELTVPRFVLAPECSASSQVGLKERARPGREKRTWRGVTQSH